MRAHDVLELPLDDEHHVLFGPHGDGGVVVLNRLARELFHDLDHPRTVSELFEARHDPHRATPVLARLMAPAWSTNRAPLPSRGSEVSRELTVWLHVTNACNLRCVYCYVHKSSAAMDDRTARDTVDALVRSALATASARSG